MQTYKYKLADSDYIEYLDGQASENRMVQYRSLLFSYGSVPISALALLAMGIRNLYIYLGLLLLCFFWIPWSRRVVGKVINTTAKKKLDEFGKRKYPEMTVILDGRNIQVIQSGQKTVSTVIGYKTYGTIMVLFMENGNQLIFPSRIFNEEKPLADLLREINEVKEA